MPYSLKHLYLVFRIHRGIERPRGWRRWLQAAQAFSKGNIMGFPTMFVLLVPDSWISTYPRQCGNGWESRATLIS